VLLLLLLLLLLRVPLLLPAAADSDAAIRLIGNRRKIKSGAWLSAHRSSFAAAAGSWLVVACLGEATTTPQRETVSAACLRCRR
jgi:hypothetical protein